MKFAPVSGDLVIKLAIAAGVLGLLWYAGRKITGAASAATTAVTDAAAQVADAVAVGVNPLNSQNVVNRGVTAAVQGATGSDTQTLGGWLYDITHSDPLAPPVVRRDLYTTDDGAQYDAMGNRIN